MDVDGSGIQLRGFQVTGVARLSSSPSSGRAGKDLTCETCVHSAPCCGYNSVGNSCSPQQIGSNENFQPKAVGVREHVQDCTTVHDKNQFPPQIGYRDCSGAACSGFNELNGGTPGSTTCGSERATSDVSGYGGEEFLDVDCHHSRLPIQSEHDSLKGGSDGGPAAQMWHRMTGQNSAIQSTSPYDSKNRRFYREGDSEVNPMSGLLSHPAIGPLGETSPFCLPSSATFREEDPHVLTTQPRVHLNATIPPTNGADYEAETYQKDKYPRASLSCERGSLQVWEEKSTNEARRIAQGFSPLANSQISTQVCTWVVPQRDSQVCSEISRKISPYEGSGHELTSQTASTQGGQIAGNTPCGQCYLLVPVGGWGNNLKSEELSSSIRGVVNRVGKVCVADPAGPQRTPELGVSSYMEKAKLDSSQERPSPYKGPLPAASHKRLISLNFMSYPLSVEKGVQLAAEDFENDNLPKDAEVLSSQPCRGGDMGGNMGGGMMGGMENYHTGGCENLPHPMCYIPDSNGDKVAMQYATSGGLPTNQHSSSSYHTSLPIQHNDSASHQNQQPSQFYRPSSPEASHWREMRFRSAENGVKNDKTVVQSLVSNTDPFASASRSLTLPLNRNFQAEADAPSQTCAEPHYASDGGSNVYSAYDHNSREIVQGGNNGYGCYNMGYTGRGYEGHDVSAESQTNGVRNTAGPCLNSTTLEERLNTPFQHASFSDPTVQIAETCTPSNAENITVVVPPPNNGIISWRDHSGASYRDVCHVGSEKEQTLIASDPPGSRKRKPYRCYGSRRLCSRNPKSPRRIGENIPDPSGVMDKGMEENLCSSEEEEEAESTRPNALSRWFRMGDGVHVCYEECVSTDVSTGNTPNATPSVDVHTQEEGFWQKETDPQKWKSMYYDDSDSNLNGKIISRLENSPLTCYQAVDIALAQPDSILGTEPPLAPYIIVAYCLDRGTRPLPLPCFLASSHTFALPSVSRTMRFFKSLLKDGSVASEAFRTKHCITMGRHQVRMVGDIYVHLLLLPSCFCGKCSQRRSCWRMEYHTVKKTMVLRCSQDKTREHDWWLDPRTLDWIRRRTFQRKDPILPNRSSESLAEEPETPKVRKKSLKNASNDEIRDHLNLPRNGNEKHCFENEGTQITDLNLVCNAPNNKDSSQGGLI